MSRVGWGANRVSTADGHASVHAGGPRAPAHHAAGHPRRTHLTKGSLMDCRRLPSGSLEGQSTTCSLPSCVIALNTTVGAVVMRSRSYSRSRRSCRGSSGQGGVRVLGRGRGGGVRSGCAMSIDTCGVESSSFHLPAPHIPAALGSTPSGHTHLHNLHMQQAQEAAAEAKAHGRRHLGLKLERRVVELQLLQRLAQVGVLVGVCKRGWMGCRRVGGCGGEAWKPAARAGSCVCPRPPHPTPCPAAASPVGKRPQNTMGWASVYPGSASVAGARRSVTVSPTRASATALIDAAR